MSTIPQRDLRNKVSEMLRRAEHGERLTITVDGRPVAELGPLTGPARFASADALTRILSEAPVDAGWADDLRMLRDDDAASAKDVWDR